MSRPTSWDALDSVFIFLELGQMRPPPASESNTRNRLFSWKEIMVTLAGFVLFLLAFATGRGRASVVLLTPKNETIAFPDTEASFAPRISGAGLFGIVFVASPLDACKPLENGPFPVQSFPIALVVRGECTFQTKVELAQNAGFAAVIVYDNEDNEDLITMSGDSTGIKIPAVFVSKAAGKILLQYVVENGTRCYILPVFENTAWSVMAVSFISLLAIFAVLAIFFVLRRHRLRQLGSRLGLTRESMSMTSKEVKALPTCIFTCIVDGKETSETCAICLEDYEIGEKLRILPCHHEFHAACIDHWLTTRRPFCPICKRDAHSKFEEPPASENTPLLTTASRGRVPGVIESHEVTQASPTGVLRADSLGSSNEDINEFFVASPVHSPCQVGTQSSHSHRYANGSPVGSPIEVQTQTSFLQTSRNSSLSKVHQQISIPQDLTNTSSVKTYTCEQASKSFDRPHKSSITATVSLPCGECSSRSITASSAHVACSPGRLLSPSSLPSFSHSISILKSPSPQKHVWDDNASYCCPDNVSADASISANAQSSSQRYIRPSSLDQLPGLSTCGESPPVETMRCGVDLC